MKLCKYSNRDSNYTQSYLGNNFGDAEGDDVDEGVGGTEESSSDIVAKLEKKFQLTTFFHWSYHQNKDYNKHHVLRLGCLCTYKII